MLTSALVSPLWLHANLAKCCVIDASWYMPAAGRNALAEYRQRHVPGAVFFDIDQVADTASPLPHMLPRSAEQFAKAIHAVGIRPRDGNPHTPLVCYSTNGAFVGSARAWWTFRAFGLRNVYVLAGGLHGWIGHGLEVVSSAQEQEQLRGETGTGASERADAFHVQYDGRLVRHLEDMIPSSSSSPSSPSPPQAQQRQQVIDARSRGRFQGTEPEPRAGLRGGHIPGSVNVPFNEVLDESGRSLRSPAQLRAAFAALDLSARGSGTIVATCGSGVTASILALALHELGIEDAAVYDGSWSEYGARDDVAVATGSGGGNERT